MKLTFRFSRIAKKLGGLTAGSLAVVTFGQAALANVIYDLAANPPAVTVVQGQNGTDTLTVTLSMQSNEQATVQFPTASTIMWQYLAGNQMDTVTGANITGGSCYTFNNAGAVIASLVLRPGGNCSIVETFSSSNSGNPNPNNDSGTWAVQSALTVKGLTSGMSLSQTVSFQAIVTDPAQAPEPATMALFGIGLIGIGTIGRKFKREKRSEANL
jgi:hypothetical protein